MPAQTGRGAPTALVLTLGAVAAAALVACGMLWQRVGNMQEQLARQSAQTGAQTLAMALRNSVFETASSI